MNIRKIFMSISLCVLICVQSLSVMALSINYNVSDRKVTVYGEATDMVSLSLFPDGIEPSDASGNTNTPVHFRMLPCSTGSYTYEFNLSADAAVGKYVLYTNDMSGKKESISFIGIKDSGVPADVLNSINNATSALELGNKAEFYATYLGVDINEDNYMPLKSKIYNLIYANDKNYNKVSEFYTDYKSAFALALLISNNDFETTLSRISLDLGIVYQSDYSDDTRLTSEIKAEFKNQITSYDWEGYLNETELSINTAFASKFAELKALSAVISAQTYNSLKKVMTVDFASDYDYVSNNSTYASLKNPDKVFSNMMGIPYNTLNDVKTQFEKQVKIQAELESESTDTNTNTGVSSRPGSSSVGVSAGAGGTSITPIQPLKTPFTDISDIEWAKPAIEELYQKGIINGKSYSMFAPNDNLTRAEFAKMAVLALAFDTNSTYHPFSDISDGWSDKYVAAAFDNGLITGLTDTSFAPSVNISREQAALILYRALTDEESSISADATFTDYNSISSWAKDAVSFMSSEGLINGRDDGSFAPLDNITRAEAAVLISRIINYIEG